MPDGRVLIAWDDGPLVADPTWTRLDDGVTFPPQFVGGFDITTGRQTLMDQVQTGTATVYINDHDEGLFDDRNASSPYFENLSGHQILLQLHNPVTDTWEPQFRGLLNDYSYDIEATLGADGKPINASIQLECVDIFDYLTGYGLTPGLDGVQPPSAGLADGVYYAQTDGTVIDRMLIVLQQAGIDSTMSIIPSGNVRMLAQKYDPDASALTVLRDAADADLPFISLVYVDRFGRVAFRGRYSSFYPDDVAAEPMSQWDFARWKVGDGTAIVADSDRAQLRSLSFERSRADLINAAMCWPQGLAPKDMPDQVFANVPSIDAEGRHEASPMSDLLVYNDASNSNADGKTTCFNYAKLIVLNKKDPRAAITDLSIKTVSPDDHRAAATWGVICGADIKHILNVDVGYPAGTGFAGDSPQDDHYIEGRHITSRPLSSGYDMVTVNYNVSPAVWSMDLNNVFPNPFA